MKTFSFVVVFALFLAGWSAQALDKDPLVTVTGRVSSTTSQSVFLSTESGALELPRGKFRNWEFRSGDALRVVLHMSEVQRYSRTPSALKMTRKNLNRQGAGQ